MNSNLKQSRTLEHSFGNVLKPLFYNRGPIISPWTPAHRWLDPTPVVGMPTVLPWQASVIDSSATLAFYSLQYWPYIFAELCIQSILKGKCFRSWCCQKPPRYQDKIQLLLSFKHLFILDVRLCSAFAVDFPIGIFIFMKMLFM